MAKVYIETTIVSYLTNRISHDLIVAAHQNSTQDWWMSRRDSFELYTSQLVIREASAGDPSAASRRIEALQGLPLLETTESARRMAGLFLRGGVVPETRAEDALHIALAIVHGMDYLLTWNCKHVANAEIRKALGDICRKQGYVLPDICTPEELMGE